MNIHQLNQNGQDLWVFLTTALIVLFVTGSAWYLTEQVNSYLKWRVPRMRQSESNTQQADDTIMIRINALIWLSHSLSWFWMIKKGIWWRFLINNKSRLCEADGSYRDGDTAAEVVAQLCQDETLYREWWERFKGRDCVWRSEPPRNGNGCDTSSVTPSSSS